MNDEKNEWAGKVAVVTGAVGPMGRNVVETLLERGTRVLGIDLPPVLAETDMAHENLLMAGADVSSYEQVLEAFEQIDEHWDGRVDYLVTIAAIVSPRHGITEVTQQEIDKVFGVNVDGTIHAVREAARRMIASRNGGSIVLISSLNGFMGRVQFPSHTYAASKGAIIGLTRSLAGELGAHGIRVNCIAPGLHVTPLAASIAGSPEETKKFFDNAAKAAPLGRVADPSEMTGPILHFFSQASGNTTGQIIASDGGRSTWYT
ncbi:MAG: SDR family oxidoreductase [Burkholderiaceae bacterium]